MRLLGQPETQEEQRSGAVADQRKQRHQHADRETRALGLLLVRREAAAGQGEARHDSAQPDRRLGGEVPRREVDALLALARAALVPVDDIGLQRGEDHVAAAAGEATEGRHDEEGSEVALAHEEHAAHGGAGHPHVRDEQGLLVEAPAEPDPDRNRRDRDREEDPEDARKGIGSAQDVLGVVGRSEGERAEPELLDAEHREQQASVGVAEDVGDRVERVRGTAVQVLRSLAQGGAGPQHEPAGHHGRSDRDGARVGPRILGGGEPSQSREDHDRPQTEGGALDAEDPVAFVVVGRELRTERVVRHQEDRERGVGEHHEGTHPQSGRPR